MEEHPVDKTLAVEQLSLCGYQPLLKDWRYWDQKDFVLDWNRGEITRLLSISDIIYIRREYDIRFTCAIFISDFVISIKSSTNKEFVKADITRFLYLM